LAYGYGYNAPLAYTAAAPLTYAAPLKYAAAPLSYPSPLKYEAAPLQYGAAPLSYGYGYATAAPVAYTTGHKVESIYEPVEQHGYKIAY